MLDVTRIQSSAKEGKSASVSPVRSHLLVDESVALRKNKDDQIKNQYGSHCASND